MDITKLIQPITFEAPPLGKVWIPVRTAGFLSWFEKAQAAGGGGRRHRLLPLDARLARRVGHGPPMRAATAQMEEAVGRAGSVYGAFSGSEDLRRR